MKLALINGSPKPKDSTSGLLCDALSALLPNLEPITVFLRKPALDAQTLSLLDSATLWFLFSRFM